MSPYLIFLAKIVLCFAFPCLKAVLLLLHDLDASQLLVAVFVQHSQAALILRNVSLKLVRAVRE